MLLVIAGCRTISTAMIDSDRIFLTTGDLHEEYAPKGLVEVRQTGLMIFGFIPASPGTLQGACDKAAAEAEKLGADALINMEYEIYKTPFPISFFWWRRGAAVRGMAVKRNTGKDKLPKGER